MAVVVSLIETDSSYVSSLQQQQTSQVQGLQLEMIIIQNQLYIQPAPVPEQTPPPVVVNDPEPVVQPIPQTPERSVPDPVAQATPQTPESPSFVTPPTTPSVKIPRRSTRPSRQPDRWAMINFDDPVKQLLKTVNSSRGCYCLAARLLKGHHFLPSQSHPFKL